MVSIKVTGSDYFSDFRGNFFKILSSVFWGYFQVRVEFRVRVCLVFIHVVPVQLVWLVRWSLAAFNDTEQ